MDQEEANKFINLLVKNLQVLCHGHVNFRNSIQVIGHLYLNVDSDVNIDYIVNEKVCKSDTSSTVFVSKSYHSEPQKKCDKDKRNTQSDNSASKNMQESSDNLSSRSSTPSNTGTQRLKRNIPHQTPGPHVKLEFDDTSDFHLTKHPRLSQNRSPEVKPTAHATPEPKGVSNIRQSEKKHSRLAPPPDFASIDLTNVKDEPTDGDEDEQSNWDYYEQQSSLLQEGLSDEVQNDFLRDKSADVYPVAMHPNELNSSFGFAGNSSHSYSSQPSSSSLSTVSPGEPGYSLHPSNPDSLNISSAIESIFNNPTRQAYSVARKRYICQYREANPNLSILDVAGHFRSKYGTDISYGTLVGILRNKGKWMSIPDDQMYSMKCKFRNK